MVVQNFYCKWISVSKCLYWVSASLLFNHLYQCLPWKSHMGQPPPICVSKIKPSLASGGDLSVMDCIILGTLKSVDPVPVPTHIYIYITLTITCVWGQQNHSLNDTLSYSVPERIGKTVAVESLSVVICLFLCGPVSISPPLYLLIMPHYTLELTLERTGSPGVALCY